MTAQRYYFADFVLDPAQRQLLCGQQQLELNARYLDALVLLVQNAGNLVSKERFFNEVWQGVVVSDEALTQCIRSLRRQLQDSAAAPLFIETVPKHGYRFIAEVTHSSATEAVGQYTGATTTVAALAAPANRYQLLWQLTGQGALGAAAAGLIGGTLYGLLGVVQALANGSQALSIFWVMLSITTMIAILAGAAVTYGLVMAKLWRPQKLSYLLLGGGVAGLLTGGFVSLLLQEAFLLFLGRSPVHITGASEGLVLGVAAGLSYWLLITTPRSDSRYRFSYGMIMKGAVPGLLAGLVISLAGGVLLAGSLSQLVAEFPNAAAGSSMALEVFRPVQGGSVPGVISAMLEAGLFITGLTLGLQRQLPIGSQN